MMTNDVVMKFRSRTLWKHYGHDIIGYKEKWAINDIEKVKEIYIQTEKQHTTHSYRSFHCPVWVKTKTSVYAAIQYWTSPKIGPSRLFIVYLHCIKIQRIYIRYNDMADYLHCSNYSLASSPPKVPGGVKRDIFS